MQMWDSLTQVLDCKTVVFFATREDHAYGALRTFRKRHSYGASHLPKTTKKRLFCSLGGLSSRHKSPNKQMMFTARFNLKPANQPQTKKTRHSMALENHVFVG